MSAIELDSTGEMARDRQGYTRIEGFDQIGQDLTWSVKVRAGEIPTDLQLGIAWLELLEAAVTDQILSQKVQEFLLTRAGVISVTVDATIDGLTRVASVTYRASASLDDLRRRTILNETVAVLI